MPTTRRRFINPHGVLHGALEVNTVQSITLTKNYQRIAAQGDNDVTDTAQFKTNLQVSGQIVLQDPIQADALLDAPAALLKWNGAPEEGGTPLDQQVTGVSFFTMNDTHAHGQVGTVTLGWNAFSPTGVDPHTAGVGT